MEQEKHARWAVHTVHAPMHWVLHVTSSLKLLMMICIDRYYKPLIRTKATSPISLPAIARQTVFQLKN